MIASALALAACLVACQDDRARAEPKGPPLDPGVRIHLGNPRIAMDWMFGLFRGSRASDPSVALANWKRATNGKGSLGKGFEAALAAMNPKMARELATLNGSELAFDFDAAGPPRWWFLVPKDDGTFSAFATATALTDGASEPPLEGAFVDRLGRPGSALMARAGDAVILSHLRDGLSRGLERLRWIGPHRGGDAGPPKIFLNAERLEESPRVDARRVGALLHGLGWVWIDIEVAMSGSEIALRCPEIRKRRPFEPLDPRWVDDVPASATLAFSFRVDFGREEWDNLFDIADGVEKADPAAAARTPIRTRLGLAARVAGVDLESAFYPKLRGVTAWMAGEVRTPAGMTVGLHMDDAASAEALRDRVLPRFAKSLGLEPSGPEPDGSRRLGRADGHEVRVWSRGSTTWLRWGAEPAATGVRLVDTLPQGERQALGQYNRLAWFFPARAGLVARELPLSSALGAAEPLRWRGDGPEIRGDEVLWRGLDRAVARFLELIPQQLAPADPK